MQKLQRRRCRPAIKQGRHSRKKAQHPVFNNLAKQAMLKLRSYSREQIRRLGCSGSMKKLSCRNSSCSPITQRWLSSSDISCSGVQRGHWRCDPRHFEANLALTSSQQPVAAFINNFFELRGDAFKLCVNSRRPLPHRSDTIGPWIEVLVSDLSNRQLVTKGILTRRASLHISAP